jgi:voltage-gated potassium channel
MKKVGADAIVSPDFTGGMRIAAAMIRPTVVTFLDEMLRSDKALRVEEIPVGARHAGRNLGMIERRGPDHIVLAVRSGAQWTFNPEPDFPLNGGETVVVVATPQGRKGLEERFA